MNLYYAMGGGLGHLTRARAFLHTLGIEKESVILTSSSFAADKRVIGDIPVCRIDLCFEKNIEAYRDLLKNILSELLIETLYLDSFPAGIVGEFAGFEFDPQIKINYVARLLKWKTYSPLLRGSTPHFEKVYILEPPETEQQDFIERFSIKRETFKLVYPTPILSEKDQNSFDQILEEKIPFWLILHAGRAEEISELINLALEMREIENSPANLILLSPNDFSEKAQNIYYFDIYPASVLFPYAEKIFTGGGFNALQQTAGFRDKHFFLPFKRRFDDQFLRASRYRNLKNKF